MILDQLFPAKTPSFRFVLLFLCVCSLMVHSGCTSARTPSIGQTATPVALLTFISDRLKKKDYESVIRQWNPDEIIKGDADSESQAARGDLEKSIAIQTNRLHVEQTKYPEEFNYAWRALQSITDQDTIWIKPGEVCQVTDKKRIELRLGSSGKILHALLQCRMRKINGRWYLDS